jgi:two-component system, OmpR family, sensor kinase
MDSLLGASRLLDGQVMFHPTELDPSALLRDACQVHRDATHGVIINESLSPLPATVYGDPKLLFHAFSNLISNAIKYAPTGSPVEAVAYQEHGLLVVQVRDHGIGIPARDRERVFERYFRGSNATRIAGTGVGLPWLPWSYRCIRVRCTRRVWKAWAPTSSCACRSANRAP